MAENILIVDENDQPTGEIMSREQALKDGRYHRLVRITVQDESGRILLQKRALNKASYPGLWTCAASGHVDAGESYDSAAPRELLEEIGISAPLEKVGVFLLQDQNTKGTLNVFSCVFKAQIPNDTQITVDPNEVSEIRWTSIADLKEDIINNPDSYTPGLKIEVGRFF